MLRLATEGVVTAIDGSTLHIAADSVCVHGDSPGAVAMARAVRALFERSGVAVRAFVTPGATGASVLPVAPAAPVAAR